MPLKKTQTDPNGPYAQPRSVPFPSSSGNGDSAAAIGFAPLPLYCRRKIFGSSRRPLSSPEHLPDRRSSRRHPRPTSLAASWCRHHPRDPSLVPAEGSHPCCFLSYVL